MSGGRANVGGVLSLTVMVWTWSTAALLLSSAKCPVRVMILSPGQLPLLTVSVKMACKPVLQLSVSSVTSPVTATLESKLQSALVKMVRSGGRVKVGGVLSLTVMVWTWSAAALLQRSARCHVRVMILSPGQLPLLTVSVKVAWRPVLQLSVSSVTSPVTATLESKVQSALVKIVRSGGRVNVGGVLSLTVMVWTWSTAALLQRWAGCQGRGRFLCPRQD